MATMHSSLALHLFALSAMLTGVVGPHSCVSVASFSPKLIRVFYFPEFFTLLFRYMHKSLHCLYGSADRESIVIRLRLDDDSD
jgi:hypothetical protein